MKTPLPLALLVLAACSSTEASTQPPVGSPTPARLPPFAVGRVVSPPTTDAGVALPYPGVEGILVSNGQGVGRASFVIEGDFNSADHLGSVVIQAPFAERMEWTCAAQGAIETCTAPEDPAARDLVQVLRDDGSLEVYQSFSWTRSKPGDAPSEMSLRGEWREAGKVTPIRLPLAIAMKEESALGQSAQLIVHSRAFLWMDRTVRSPEEFVVTVPDSVDVTFRVVRPIPSTQLQRITTCDGPPVPLPDADFSSIRLSGKQSSGKEISIGLDCTSNVSRYKIRFVAPGPVAPSLESSDIDGLPKILGPGARSGLRDEAMTTVKTAMISVDGKKGEPCGGVVAGVVVNVPVGTYVIDYVAGVALNNDPFFLPNPDGADGLVVVDPKGKVIHFPTHTPREESLYESNAHERQATTLGPGYVVGLWRSCSREPYPAGLRFWSIKAQ